MKTLFLLTLAALGGVAVYGQQVVPAVDMAYANKNGGYSCEFNGHVWDDCTAAICQIYPELKGCEREPFDEAPQQWATYEWDMQAGQYQGPYTGAVFAIWIGPKLTEEKHVGCADPKRVLLTSEDQVKHCYLFGDSRQ